MKAVALLFPLVTMLLLGCNRENELTKEAPAAAPDTAASAPADYLKSVARSQQKAVKTIDLTAINKAIERFYVQEGRYPRSLEELVDQGLMRTLPSPPPGLKFNYATNIGVVTLEKDLWKQ